MHANPRWLLGVVEGGLVAVGAERDLEVELDAPFEHRRRLLELLVDGAEPAALATASETKVADAEALLERLRESGALVGQRDRHAQPPGIGLGGAIIAAARGDPAGRYVWTAEELLVLPEGTDPALARRALRAFVAGLASEARLRAYCYVATWLEPTTWGDLPGADRLAAGQRAAESLDPAAVHVVDLREGRVESAPADRVGSLGAARPHRLGAVLSEVIFSLPGQLNHSAAIYSVSNLRYPRRASERVGRGTAPEPERAAARRARFIILTTGG